MHTTTNATYLRFWAALFTSLALFCGGCATTSANKPTPPPASDAMHMGQQAYQAQRYQAAYEIFSTLAEQGNADAQYILGYMLFYGQGLEPNAELAIQWFQRASKQGHPKAQQALQALQKQAR